MIIRMFISIPINDTDSIVSVLDDIKQIRNVKASPISQLHITMRFIGDIDDGKTKKVVKAVEDAVEDIQPFSISIRGIGCFPNLKRPNVIWVGVKPEDVLKKMADRISVSLKSMNISFDEKPFKSHVTVGRCSGPADVAPLLEKYRDTEFTSFECDRILIMRSELSPKGAKHTILHTVNIGSE